MPSPLTSAVKTVFRVDYDATLDFYERLYPAAADVRDGYPDWETDRLKVVLKNFEDRCSLTISHAAFFYSQDHLNAVSKEEARINKVIEILPNALGKQKIKRAGLRRQYLLPVEMEYADLVQLMKGKFLTPDPLFHEGICPHFDDLQVVFTFKHSGFKMITIAPTFRDQLSRVLQLDVTNNFRAEDVWILTGEVFADYPLNSVYVDCDFAETDLECRALASFYQRAREEHAKLIENVQRFTLGID